MLQGHQSISSYNKRNLAIWIIMAFQAGYLNTGGFLACHTFVSHVTGYATLFGTHLYGKDIATAVGILTVPLLFLLGAMMSGVLVDMRLKLNKAPKYYIVFGFLFLLTSLIYIGGVANLFGAFGEPLLLTRDYVLLAILCLICGVQNGSVSTVSNSIVRTTHLTGVTTDLGLGVVRTLYKDKLPSEMIKGEMRANRMRIGIIISFILGSFVGTVLLSRHQYAGFLLPAIIYLVLFVSSLTYQILQRRA